MAWGIAGFLVGVIIAFQLWAPALNFGLPFTIFGDYALAGRTQLNVRSNETGR
jgi:cbb3-type cytochrome oxidase subunit 1